MNKNILGIKIGSCINPEVLLKNFDDFYISACNYNTDENILYNYNTKANTLEKIYSVDLETFFFCDNISKTIYKCKQSDKELLIYKMNGKQFTCIYKKNLFKNNHLADIYSIDENIFIKLQNDSTNVYQSYLILESNTYKINNKYFCNSMYKPDYINYKGNIFLVIDESNFQSNELSEMLKYTINNIDLFNRITLYNLSDFIESIKSNKIISNNILIESKYPKEFVQLLGVYKNNIIVLYKNITPEILIFDINNDFKSIDINNNIIDILKEEKLYYIYKSEGQLGILDENQQQILSINNSSEGERVSIVGIYDSKYVIYKKEYYEDEKIETYVYDLAFNKYLKYDSDFVFIQDSLI